MRASKFNIVKLAALQEEFFTEYDSAVTPAGERNRDALLRMSALAGQMARIHEEEAAELRRVAGQAHDLALTK